MYMYQLLRRTFWIWVYFSGFVGLALWNYYYLSGVEKEPSLLHKRFDELWMRENRDIIARLPVWKTTSISDISGILLKTHCHKSASSCFERSCYQHMLERNVTHYNLVGVWQYPINKLPWDVWEWRVYVTLIVVVIPDESLMAENLMKCRGTRISVCVSLCRLS